MNRLRSIRFTCHALVCVAVGAVAVSCSPGPMSERWVEARPLAREAASYRPPRFDVERYEAVDKAASPSANDLTGDVTLNDAIAQALIQNPTLQSFGWEVRAAEARALQAGLWPNPRAGVVSENHGGPDRVEVRNTLRISQVIELGDKRKKRIDLAEADRALVAWDYEEQRVNVVAEVARRHVATLAAQQRVSLNRRTLRLAEQVLQIVTDRVDAGVTPTSERDKALVRVSIERIRLNRAERQLASARQSLAATWGGKTATFDSVVGAFDRVTDPPDRATAVSRVGQNPRIARYDDEIEQRRRAVELAKAQGVPNLTAGAGVRHFADSDSAAAVVEFSLPIPIIDRNQGGVLEARYRVAQAKAQQRAAEIAVNDELVRSFEALAAAHFEVRTLQRETLPAAQNAFNAARESFKQGRTDYLNVLDAERTLVDVERQLLDATETYHQRTNDAEAVLAGPLEID